MVHSELPHVHCSYPWGVHSACRLLYEGVRGDQGLLWLGTTVPVEDKVQLVAEDKVQLVAGGIDWVQDKHLLVEEPVQQGMDRAVKGMGHYQLLQVEELVQRGTDRTVEGMGYYHLQVQVEAWPDQWEGTEYWVELQSQLDTLV